jgi:hypothetical protein
VWQATDVDVPYGGTGVSTLTDGGILLGSGSSAITALGVASNGQIPIGDGATDPVLATLTGTASEIDITNGAGSITIGIVDPLAVAKGGTGATSLNDLITLTTHTTGDYVKDVADGTGIDGTATGEGSTYTPTFDATELDALAWSDGSNATNAWTFDVSGTDHTMTAGSGLMSFSKDVSAAEMIFINETSDAGITIGMSINQGANDNRIMSFKSSDVAHGITDIAETDTWWFARKQSGPAGGANISGVRNADGLSQDALVLGGYLGEAASTGKGKTHRGVITTRSFVTDGGTGTQAIGANGNLIAFLNASDTVFIFDADGTINIIPPLDDNDIDVITIDVTGDPTFSWDESDDRFAFDKGLNILGDTYINTNSTTALFVEQDGVNDNTLVVDTTNGVIGIGATPSPTTLVNAQRTITATTANLGILGQITLGQTANTAGQMLGFQGALARTVSGAASSITYTGDLIGLKASVAISDQKATPDDYGDIYGGQSSISLLSLNGGNVTNMIGHLIASGNAGGFASVTNNYGLKIDAISGATNNWAINLAGGNTYFGTDNDKSMWGTTNTDLQIYSDGTDGRIDTSGNLLIDSEIRGTTTLYRRYYHLPLASFDPGASGAAWTDASANNLAGWLLNASTDTLEFGTDVHADWDGVSDLTIEMYFSVSDATTVNNDTVDLVLVPYYMGTGDSATKTQAIAENVTTTDGTQWKTYEASFTIDEDFAGNNVDPGDKISFVLHMETDTSEVDDVIIYAASFFYNTTHVGIESGDT